MKLSKIAEEIRKTASDFEKYTIAIFFNHKKQNHNERREIVEYLQLQGISKVYDIVQTKSVFEATIEFDPSKLFYPDANKGIDYILKNYWNTCYCFYK